MSGIINLFVEIIFFILINYTVSKADGYCEGDCSNRITVDTNSYTSYYHCVIPCKVKGDQSEKGDESCECMETIICDSSVNTIVTTTQTIKTDSTEKTIFKWRGLKGEKPIIKEMVVENFRAVRITDSNISREIIHFEDPCSFAIVEPSGKTINFKFDDKKSLKDLRKQYSSIVTSKITLDKKKEIDTSFVYSWIIDEKYKECKKE
jgi:hypothetical protein